MREKELFKMGSYAVRSLLSAVVIGTLLMIIVYLLPTNAMREHVEESILMYEDTADFPAWAPGYVYSITDNVTDSIMISEAIFEGEDSAVRNAMLNPYIRYFDAEELTDSLVMSINGDAAHEARVVNYARYWHGYLIWLKPALILFDLSGIKTVNSFLQIFLLMYVTTKLAQKLGNKYALAFVPVVCMLNPVTIGMCFQYSSVYYVTLLTMASILKWYGLSNADQCWKVLVWAGIATAYFDFLTYPMVSLGVPLVLILLLGDFSWKKGIWEILKNSVAWGFGYAGMWSSKWLMSFLLTGENTVKEAVSFANYRMSGDIPDAQGNDSMISGMIHSVRGNLSALNNGPIWLIIGIVVLVIAVLLVKGKYKIEINNKQIPIMLLALYPFAWYIVLANHSGIHIFMAYRELAISGFALLGAVAKAMVQCEDKQIRR